MARPIPFTCTACGAAHSRWSGQCDSCGEWNRIVEGEAPSPVLGAATSRGRVGPAVTLDDLAAQAAPPPRTASGIAEFDRVLGGGLTPASATLIGGDPGIGKSTLLLQAAARLAVAGLSAIYVTGEEASAQIRARAARLGIADAPVRIATATSLRDILAMLEAERPQVVVIDSIQTVWADTVDSAPGSVSQVRAAGHELAAFAKRRDCAVLFVGHVTKDGQIAGPRVVEHLVDTVLYFEGERGHQFRILRAVKNRYGAADEIGVFEMTGSGLAEVANPSELFLADRGAPAPGSVVFAGIEGTRPLLVEIQALVAPTPHAQPRRAVVGLDAARLAMVLAVLEARCSVSFAGLDVYLNVAGGIRIGEPAADLAVAAALLGARQSVSLPADSAVFGEVSLSGALRPVARTESRLKEARKLGFMSAALPSGSKTGGVRGIQIGEHGDLRSFVDDILAGSDARRDGGGTPNA